MTSSELTRVVLLHLENCVVLVHRETQIEQCPRETMQHLRSGISCIRCLTRRTLENPREVLRKVASSMPHLTRFPSVAHFTTKLCDRHLCSALIHGFETKIHTARRCHESIACISVVENGTFTRYTNQTLFSTQRPGLSEYLSVSLHSK